MPPVLPHCHHGAREQRGHLRDSQYNCAFLQRASFEWAAASSYGVRPAHTSEPILFKRQGSCDASHCVSTCRGKNPINQYRLCRLSRRWCREKIQKTISKVSAPSRGTCAGGTFILLFLVLLRCGRDSHNCLTHTHIHTHTHNNSSLSAARNATRRTRQSGLW